MDRTHSREFDLITGLIICVIAGGIFALSLGYIGKTVDNGLPYYRSAGFFPAIISSILFISACYLVRLALQSELNFRYLLTGDYLNTFKKRTLDFLLVVGWLGFYIFVLLTHFSYPIASCIFLFIFMVLFHSKERRPMTVRCGIRLLLAAFLMSQILSFMFRDVARIPLP